jgi:hypothetical protein
VQGVAGPTGPPGIPLTARVADNAIVPIVGGAEPALLATVPVMTTEKRNMLISGGFNAACNPCSEDKTVAVAVVVNSDTAVTRQFTVPRARPESMTISEMIEVPAGCAPCTITLRASTPADAGGAGGNSTVDASGRTLSFADLGSAP